MKTMKKSVRLALVFALVVATVFTITACFGNGSTKHKHSYTSVVTAPTCTEEGYTTYTCKCGDTYVDDYVDPAHTLVNHKAKNATCTEPGNEAYVACSKCSYSTYVATPALGHDYKSEVIKNPTMGEAGIRCYTCSRCNDSYEEEIDALSAVLPDISNAIFSIFGDVDFRLSAAKDSTIVLIEEIGGGENVENYVFFAINIAEITINTKAEVPEARFILEFGMAHATVNRGDEEPTVDNFDSVAAIAVFLTGDQIAFELIDLEGVTESGAYSANELFYTAVANYFGISYDELLMVVSQINDLQQYLPLIEEILGSLGTDLPEIEAGTYSVSEESNPVFTFDFETIFTTTVDENGNTVYTFNIEAIKDFITSLNDITVGEYVDSTYGEGTMDSVCEFIVGIPNMTVKEIANMAIELSESYNVDIHDVYSLFEDVIYLATGTEIDIESAIEGSADLTIGEIIIANSYSSDITEEEKKEYLESVEETFGILADVIPELNIDNIYNLYYYGDPFYSTDGEEVFSITDNLISALSSAEELIKFELVVNAEGEFVSIETMLGMYEFSFEVNEENDETTYVGDVVYDDKDYLDLEVTVADDGAIESAEIVIRNEIATTYYENEYSDGDVTYYETVPGDYEFVDFCTISLSTVQNADGSETLALVVCGVVHKYKSMHDATTGEYIGYEVFDIHMEEFLKVEFTNKENGFSSLNKVGFDENTIYSTIDFVESDTGVTLTANVTDEEDIEFLKLTYETTDGYVSGFEFVVRKHFGYEKYDKVYDEETGEYVIEDVKMSEFGDIFHIFYEYENQDSTNLNFYYEVGELVIADDYSDASVVPNRILEVSFAHSTNSDNDVVEAYITVDKITIALDYTNADNTEKYEATISHEDEEETINADFVIDNSVEGQVKYTIDLYDIDEDAMDFELVISGDTITYLNWIVRGNHRAYHNDELVAEVPYEIFKVLYSRVEEDGNLDISFDFEQSYVHVEYEYDDFGNYVSVNAVPQVEVSYSINAVVVNEEDYESITLSLVDDDVELVFYILSSETVKSITFTGYEDDEKMVEVSASAELIKVDGEVTEVVLSLVSDAYIDGEKYDVYSSEIVVTEDGITSIVIDFNFVTTHSEGVWDDEGYHTTSTTVELEDGIDIEYSNDYCGNFSFSAALSDVLSIAISTNDSDDGFAFSIDCAQFNIAVNSVSTETGNRTTIDYDLNKVYVSYDESYIYNNDPIVEIEEVENCTNYFYYMSELVKREDGIYETYDGYDIWIALDSPLTDLGGMTLNELVEYYIDYIDIDTYNQLKSLADEKGRVPVTDESIELLMDLLGYEDYWYVPYYLYYAVEIVSYEPPVICYHYYYISGAGQLVIETK